VAEATVADYAWFKDHWLRQAFCITLVRGMDEVEVLRRLGGERSQPRMLTVGEAGELSGSFHAGYPQIVMAATRGGWAVAVEDNGWEGSRPEVLRALSADTQAVSVYQNVNALGHFSYAVDGALLVQFEPLFPQRRWGSQPDLLLPQMRAVGLDPDWQQPPYGDIDTAALALAERVTGVHLDPRVLDGPLSGVEIAPLLDDPPASLFFGGEDAELAAVIDQASPGVLRRAAARAAHHAVQLAELEHDAVVVEALAAAQAGQARQVDDHSPLGWRIRTWAMLARIADRVRNDPSASLDAQRRKANLLRAAGQAAEQPHCHHQGTHTGDRRRADPVAEQRDPGGRRRPPRRAAPHPGSITSTRRHLPRAGGVLHRLNRVASHRFGEAERPDSAVGITGAPHRCPARSPGGFVA
jgi:hypothetical protein